MTDLDPEDQDSPFHQWYFREWSPDRMIGPNKCPMASELLWDFADNDQNRFERLNYYLERAFDAGTEYQRTQRGAAVRTVLGGEPRHDPSQSNNPLMRELRRKMRRWFWVAMFLAFLLCVGLPVTLYSTGAFG